MHGLLIAQLAACTLRVSRCAPHHVIAGCFSKGLCDKSAPDLLLAFVRFRSLRFFVCNLRLSLPIHRSDSITTKDFVSGERHGRGGGSEGGGPARTHAAERSRQWTEQRHVPHCTFTRALWGGARHHWHDGVTLCMLCLAAAGASRHAHGHLSPYRGSAVPRASRTDRRNRERPGPAAVSGRADCPRYARLVPPTVTLYTLKRSGPAEPARSVGNPAALWARTASRRLLGLREPAEEVGRRLAGGVGARMWRPWAAEAE